MKPTLILNARTIIEMTLTWGNQRISHKVNSRNPETSKILKGFDHLAKKLQKEVFYGNPEVNPAVELAQLRMSFWCPCGNTEHSLIQRVGCLSHAAFNILTLTARANVIKHLEDLEARKP